MEAYNQNLLQDASYHLDNHKTNLTKLKLAYNRDRELVSFIDQLIKDCDLIELIIKSYDKHNIILLCAMANHSFSNPTCHGVIITIIKKRFTNNLDRGRMNYINFPI